MKANELRIGNWVNDKDYGVCIVSSINSNRYDRFGNSDEDSPLTSMEISPQ